MHATKNHWAALLSGLASCLGAMPGKLFRKKNGRVSAYRVVLAATLAAFGWGLWAGWAQWVAFGEGIAGGGFLVSSGTFLARWALAAWLASVLLWTAVADKDDLLAGTIIPSLFVCLIGTFVQAAVVHNFFADSPPPTHYWSAVSCEHCEASCRVRVKIGESWTDWPGVTCCKCGITIPAEKVPEYAKTRVAWDARVVGGAEHEE